jgi:hypothetical protein
MTSRLVRTRLDGRCPRNGARRKPSVGLDQGRRQRSAQPRPGGLATTPARPNADGGIDFSSKTAQVAGAFWLRGTRPATRSATGRSGALALANSSAGCHWDLELGSGIGLPGHKTCGGAAGSALNRHRPAEPKPGSTAVGMTVDLHQAMAAGGPRHFALERPPGGKSLRVIEGWGGVDRSPQHRGSRRGRLIDLARVEPSPARERWYVARPVAC